MSYPFPAELQRLVQDRLSSGDYASEDEVLMEGVRLLCERDQHLQDFKAQLRERLNRLDRGEGTQLEDEEALRAFFDDIQMRGKQRYEAGNRAP